MEELKQEGERTAFYVLCLEEVQESSEEGRKKKGGGGFRKGLVKFRST